MNLKLGLVFFLSYALGVAQTIAENSPKVTVLKSEFIFDEAPFLQCHSSTLIELANGEFMVSWFGGTHERNDDVSIYESHGNANHWSKPKQIADGIANDTLRYPTWNPVLFKNNTGVLFLFYKVGPSPSTWWGMYKTSLNDGLTWSESTTLPEGILGPIKNKAITLKTGRILAPSSVEIDNGAIWKSHVEISDDDGYTWQRSEIPASKGVKIIQPTLITLPDDTIKALLRSDQNIIMESVSSDDGISWSKAVEGKIKNPNSGVDALSLSDGNYLLVYNPTLSGNDWSDGRHKLNLAYSTDGTNWQDILKLEDRKKGEFSYPAIIQDSKGYIHITYTYNRKKIKYLKLELSKLP